MICKICFKKFIAGRVSEIHGKTDLALRNNNKHTVYHAKLRQCNQS